MEYFQDMVGRFREIGIDEFVLYWPQTWGAAPREEAVFQEVTATVMPRLRADAMTQWPAPGSRHAGDTARPNHHAKLRQHS